MPPRAQLQEQRLLEQRDSDHEKVSMDLGVHIVAHEQASPCIFFLSNHRCVFDSLCVVG